MCGELPWAISRKMPFKREPYFLADLIDYAEPLSDWVLLQFIIRAVSIALKYLR
jgi:hypothetical protein